MKKSATKLKANSEIILKAVKKAGYQGEVRDSFGTTVVYYKDENHYNWDEPSSLTKIYNSLPFNTSWGNSWDDEGNIEIKIVC